MGRTVRILCSGVVVVIVACVNQTPTGPRGLAASAVDTAAAHTRVVQTPSASPAAATQYDPLADPALVLCLDDRSPFCKDTNGTQQCVDGDSCAFWGDRSGNGYHARAIAGVGRPAFHADALGGRPGLGWNGSARALTLGTPGSLTALQSASFTLLVAATYHAGTGWIIAKCAGASDGIYSIYVLDSLPGMYHSNRGVPVVSDEFFTMAVASDRSRTEVNGVKRFYQNGAPRTSTIGAPAVDTSQEIEIGSIATGRQYYSWNGGIFAVLLYSRALTAAEILQTDQYLRTRYAQSWQGSSSPMIVLWDGNSISMDDQIQEMVAKALGITPNVVFNFAWGSKTTTNMNAYASADVDAVLPFLPTGKTVVSVGWEITNDLMTGASNSGAYRNVMAYGQARRALGMRHVAASCLPRSQGGFDARRDVVNDSIRTTYGQFADALADVATNATMGQDGQSTNTIYYGDGVHPTTQGKDTLAPYFVNAIQSAAGHTSTAVLKP